MARKHRRRTRKRSKKGGSSVMGKIGDGFTGLKEGVQHLGRKGQEFAAKTGKGVERGATQIADGFRSTQGGVLDTPPTLSHTSIYPSQSSLQPEPEPEPQLQHYQSPMKSKEKKGGLLGLGTWIGLGGRRRAHTSFVNKMLRVKNSRKRNRAIRKYLSGGKKRKTRKGGRRKRKRKTKKHRRR